MVLLTTKLEETRRDCEIRGAATGTMMLEGARQEGDRRALDVDAR
jgi:hypothetical protein